MARRRTKKTRYVFCEGAQDKAFLECVKSWYAGEVYHVDIKRGNGGDQVNLVETAVKRGSAYGEIFVKLDGDRDESEMSDAVDLALKEGVVLLRSEPAIERLLIAILEPTKRTASWNSEKLKNYFEEKYIPSVKRTDTRAYQRIFTKEVLDEAAERLGELRGLIGLF